MNLRTTKINAKKVVGICPRCNNLVYEGSQKYYCCNSVKHRCNFLISKKYFKKWGVTSEISTRTMISLLHGGEVALKDLFTVKNKKKFDCDAIVSWLPERGKWGFSFTNTVWHD